MIMKSEESKALRRSQVIRYPMEDESRHLSKAVSRCLTQERFFTRHQHFKADNVSSEPLPHPNSLQVYNSAPIVHTYYINK